MNKKNSWFQGVGGLVRDTDAELGNHKALYTCSDRKIQETLALGTMVRKIQFTLGALPFDHFINYLFMRQTGYPVSCNAVLPVAIFSIIDSKYCSKSHGPGFLNIYN